MPTFGPLVAYRTGYEAAAATKSKRNPAVAVLPVLLEMVIKRLLNTKARRDEINAFFGIHGPQGGELWAGAGESLGAWE